MIRTLRSALAAGLLLTGCLVPQPLEEEPEVENLPPYFVASTVTPSYLDVVPYDPATNGRTLVLRIDGIFDPNPGDLVFWRAFVDYNPLLSAAPRFGNGRGIEPGADAQITLSIVDPCNQFLNDGPVAIEVVVADRPFLSTDEEPDPPTTPNQHLPADAGSFRLAWIILMDRSLCEG